MADFSFLSDSDSSSGASDSAVNELLSQTRDLCVLDQISALNCASFPHSDLPSDLESRFARLKSFPSAAAAGAPPQPLPAPPHSDHPSPPQRKPPPPPPIKKASKSDSQIRSPPVSPESGGCLSWWSPKKNKKTKKKSRARRGGDSGSGSGSDSDFGWSKNEELLADLGSFPVKEQRKILKKAMEEQRKISREARKIVKMAKQASIKSSTSVSVVEYELLSDH